MLKNITKYLKNLKRDLEKYQHNITYGLDCLFNEFNEDYYEPKKNKSVFDGSYMLYESRGDKDDKLAIYEYFGTIQLLCSHKLGGFLTPPPLPLPPCWHLFAFQTPPGFFWST